LGGGGAPGLAPLGRYASSMLGSKLPRSEVGFLLRVGGLADVAADIFGELVGGHNAVARLVGGALQALDHVIGEDAVAAAPIGALEGTLAVAAAR